MKKFEVLHPDCSLVGEPTDHFFTIIVLEASESAAIRLNLIEAVALRNALSTWANDKRSKDAAKARSET